MDESEVGVKVGEYLLWDINGPPSFWKLFLTYGQKYLRSIDVGYARNDNGCNIIILDDEIGYRLCRVYLHPPQQPPNTPKSKAIPPVNGSAACTVILLLLCCSTGRALVRYRR